MATSTVFRNIQIGKQSALNTAVAAPTKLPAFRIEIQPQGGEGRGFTADGQKYASFVVPDGDEMSAVSITGEPCFNHLAYIFAGAIKDVTPAQQAATAAYLWTWEPDTDGPDTGAIYTAEEGPTAVASEVSDMIITGWTLRFTRTAIEITAEGFASKVEDDITLTGSPVALTVRKMLSQNTDVYLEDTQAALAAATALDNLSEVEIHLTGVRGNWWPVNSSKTVYSVVPELAGDFGGTIKMLNDADGQALRATMRAGERKWLKVSVSGETIEDTYDEALDITIPIELTTPGDKQDDEGAYALGFNFMGVDDPTWGKALSITLMNSVDAL